jgi:hypothetical protein
MLARSGCHAHEDERVAPVCLRYGYDETVYGLRAIDARVRGNVTAPYCTKTPCSCWQPPGQKKFRAQAATLAREMERHQVPVEYLASPELAQALQRAHDAKTPKAVAVADADIKERMFLIGKDGINGPDIDQLRKETTANINGADDSHFKGSRVRESSQGHARSQAPGQRRLQRLPVLLT